MSSVGSTERVVGKKHSSDPNPVTVAWNLPASIRSSSSHRRSSPSALIRRISASVSFSRATSPAVVDIGLPLNDPECWIGGGGCCVVEGALPAPPPPAAPHRGAPPPHHPRG